MEALDGWAVLIRNRLGTLRHFDSTASEGDAGAVEGAAGS